MSVWSDLCAACGHKRSAHFTGKGAIPCNHCDCHGWEEEGTTLL